MIWKTNPGTETLTRRRRRRKMKRKTTKKPTMKIPVSGLVTGGPGDNMCNKCEKCQNYR